MRLSIKLSPHTFQQILDYIEVRKSLFGEDCSHEQAIGEMAMIGKNQMLVAKASEDSKKFRIHTTERTDN